MTSLDLVAPTRTSLHHDPGCELSVSRRMELDGSHMEAPDEVLRKLSLAGGLMARVAFVDGDVTQGEKDTMKVDVIFQLIGAL